MISLIKFVLYKNVIVCNDPIKSYRINIDAIYEINCLISLINELGMCIEDLKHIKAIDNNYDIKDL